MTNGVIVGLENKEKGEFKMFKRQNYVFDVPDKKKVRMIVYTDCKNEADDQYALAHHIMTPAFIIPGIIAAHFNGNPQKFGDGHTAQASYDEVEKVLNLMHVKDEFPVYLGSEYPLADDHTPRVSEAAKFIVEEAMKEDPHPLFIACQGSITDLASAIMMEPKICERMTAIWIGGGIYPEGGREFNLFQDLNAANILFNSKMPVRQVPMDVYKQMSVTLAELQRKVMPYGNLGRYLVEQMIEFNNTHGDDMHWPHGEIWGLGDQGTIAVMLEESEKTDIYEEIEAPNFDLTDGHYIYGQENRKIRVYHTLNARTTLEDFFCKLQLNFPETDS